MSLSSGISTTMSDASFGDWTPTAMMQLYLSILLLIFKEFLSTLMSKSSE